MSETWVLFFGRQLDLTSSAPSINIWDIFFYNRKNANENDKHKRLIHYTSRAIRVALRALAPAPAQSPQQERLEIIAASGHSASCCVLIINETARAGKPLRPAQLPLATLRFIHKTDPHIPFNVNAKLAHTKTNLISILKSSKYLTQTNHNRPVGLTIPMNRNRRRKKS